MGTCQPAPILAVPPLRLSHLYGVLQNSLNTHRVHARLPPAPIVKAQLDKSCHETKPALVSRRFKPTTDFYFWFSHLWSP